MKLGRAPTTASNFISGSSPEGGFVLPDQLSIGAIQWYLSRGPRDPGRQASYRVRCISILSQLAYGVKERGDSIFASYQNTAFVRISSRRSNRRRNRFVLRESESLGISTCILSICQSRRTVWSAPGARKIVVLEELGDAVSDVKTIFAGRLATLSHHNASFTICCKQ
jgi:hypothetical protein